MIINKKLYIDTKTSGFDPSVHGLVHVRAIAEVDGEQVDSITLNFRPFVADKCDPDALTYNGLTEAELRTKERQSPKKAQKEFLEFLMAHVDPYAKGDSFTLIGHNVGFHMDFLKAWFEKAGDKAFFTVINSRPICTLALARYMSAINASRVKNLKGLDLDSVAREFNGVIKGDKCKTLYLMWPHFEQYLMEVVS